MIHRFKVLSCFLLPATFLSASVLAQLASKPNEVTVDWNKTVIGPGAQKPGRQTTRTLTRHQDAYFEYGPENIGLKMRMSRQSKFPNRIFDINWATVPNRAQ